MYFFYKNTWEKRTNPQPEQTQPRATCTAICAAALKGQHTRQPPKHKSSARAVLTCRDTRAQVLYEDGLS